MLAAIVLSKGIYIEPLLRLKHVMTKKQPIRISIVSLGCPKTLVDSETILGKFQNARFVITQNPRKSNVAVLNTCSFIQDAKKESIEALLKLIELKKSGKLLALIVIGCLVQHYVSELEREFPEVDAFVGSGDYQKMEQILKKVLRGKRLVSVHQAGYLAQAQEPRISLTPLFYRYLKISEGCNHTCSFCVIPLLRGKFRSRKIPDILHEAKILAHEGAKELILIGQDITKFGYDYAKKSLLPELLQELERIKSVNWIRLLYAHPSSLVDAVIQLIAQSSKICHYLDLPLQHINDRILTSMRRGMGKKKTLELVQKLRGTIPGLVLRTSFIVGFPGETEREFEELLEFMRLVRFERLGIFKYSQEQGSQAATMKNQISERIKEKRFHQAMQLQQTIVREASRSWVGTILQVLVEKRDSRNPEQWIGRSYMDAPEIDGNVLVRTAKTLQAGKFYPVKITGVKNYDLIGQI